MIRQPSCRIEDDLAIGLADDLAALLDLAASSYGHEPQRRPAALPRLLHLRISESAVVLWRSLRLSADLP